MAAKKLAECFDCPELSKEEHIALKNLYSGEADEGQQRLALAIIVNKFSRTHDLTYIPGSFDQSSFTAGRAFVGQKILKYLNLPVGKLKEEEKHGEN